MDASAYLELDNELIATGNVIKAKGSLFDFRQGRAFRQGLEDGIEQNRCVGNGYDHYFYLITLNMKASVFMNQKRPCAIDGNHTAWPCPLYRQWAWFRTRTYRRAFKKIWRFCLEAQASPASLQYDDLPHIWLEPGTIYQHETVYRFSTQ